MTSSKRRHQIPIAGVTDNCEPLCEFWRLNPRSPQEWQVLITSEPSPQPQPGQSWRRKAEGCASISYPVYSWAPPRVSPSTNPVSQHSLRYNPIDLHGIGTKTDFSSLTRTWNITITRSKRPILYHSACSKSSSCLWLDYLSTQHITGHVHGPPGLLCVLSGNKINT